MCRFDPFRMALISARQVLNKESDATGNDDVQQATSTFVKTLDDLNLKRRIDVLETPVEFLSMQTFSLHLLYYLTTHHKENSQDDYAKNI